MSLPSNAAPQTALDSQTLAAASPFATRPFYWSIRRELWECRYIYLAPLAVAAIYLLGFLLLLPGVPHAMRTAMALDSAHQREPFAQPYDFAAAAIMGVAFLLGMFYCLDALYGERRDRSILFWKSLPVSDSTTVLAKAAIPIVLVPLESFVITFALQFVMLLLSSAVLLAGGLNVALLWSQLALFRTSWLLLYHLITVHMLWYAPIYAWLLLVSAWARRTPLLWAVLPPVAIAIFERVVFHTAHFAAFIGNRFGGNESADMSSMPGNFPIHPMMRPTLGHFLSTPGLWFGLVFAALFLAAAVRLRRYREPI
jgi:ABC-2 type transport system permease protein